MQVHTSLNHLRGEGEKARGRGAKGEGEVQGRRVLWSEDSPAGGCLISSSICSAGGIGMGYDPMAISIRDTPKLQMSERTE